MANGEKCNNKDCKVIVTEIRKKDGEYKKYCSPSCQRLSVAEKAKQTALDRYGVSNPSKSKIIKDRIKETFTEKYGKGITNSMHIQSFVDKITDTNIRKYGTDKPQTLDKFQQKTIESNIKKFGTERPQRLQDFKDRSRETCITKYGVSAPQQNKIIRQKSADTCIEKYGVSNPSQNSEIYEKIVKNQLRTKKYILPSGIIVSIQGYEAFALNNLLKIYTEDEIIVSKGCMPFIKYFADSKSRRYFPDIYIPKDNLIVEVKSNWTLNTNRPRNMAKRQACLDAGYNFKFMIFDKDGNLLEEST
jgi:hypothetical protein